MYEIVPSIYQFVAFAFVGSTSTLLACLERLFFFAISHAHDLNSCKLSGISPPDSPTRTRWTPTGATTTRCERSTSGTSEPVRGREEGHPERNISTSGWPKRGARVRLVLESDSEDFTLQGPASHAFLGGGTVGEALEKVSSDETTPTHYTFSISP